MPREIDKEPGFVAVAVAGVRLVGLRGALRTATFGLRKLRLDARYEREHPVGPEVRPGPLEEIEVDGATARFSYGLLALEATVLQTDLVRLTWTPGRLPVTGYGDALAGVPLHHEERLGVHVLTTDGLRLTVGREGAVTVEERTGPEAWQVVRRERPPVRAGERWTATVDLEPDDRVHGLGERAAAFDLRPGSYGLWNTEQSGSYGPEADPLYITIPVHAVVAPGRSHLGFWENSHRGRVEVGDQLTATFDGGALRTHVAVGPLHRALDRYADLTGRPAPPPRWALGYHQCRWGYRTEADVREVVAGFRENDLPLSAIHLDIDYMDRYRVFTVDEVDFPDLGGLIADLNADGVEVVTIIDPGVAKADDFPLYREGRADGRFLKDERGNEVNGVVWPGPVGFPDFTDPDVRAWWAVQYPALLDKGVAGIWHDMCEPAVFAAGVDPALPLGTRHSLEGRGGDHVEGRNLYGLGMAQAGFEAQRTARPDRRPWLLTRSGWAGVQRYAWTWTGDVATSWLMLRRTIATVLNLSLSGVPYTGPDIGGFSGDPSPELYTRWFQASSWLPFFRSHSIYTMPSREPWKAAGPHLEAVREAMAWRYRLLPYWYTLAVAASERGDLPIIRPVWWPGTDDPDLLAVDDAFLVGDQVLVAPVLEEGATSREVSLPPGRWHELASDGAHERTATLAAPIERIPVLVRAGTVLPTDEDGRNVVVVVPPGGAMTESSWYRDAGDGYGPGRWDRFAAEPDGDGFVVRRDHTGAFAVDDSDLGLRVHGGGRWRVAFDGGDPVEAGPDQPAVAGGFTVAVVRPG